MARLAPIAYDPVNHYYHVLGDKVGNAFARRRKTEIRSRDELIRYSQET